MEFWIVIEEESGEVYVRPFNCYVHEHCTGHVKIERHVMNLGWQGKEDFE
jgi:hypothetical protein